MIDVNDAFNRVKGGTVSRPNIDKIVANPSRDQDKSLLFLAKKLSSDDNFFAWRLEGLLADGLILVNGIYYIVELKKACIGEALLALLCS